MSVKILLNGARGRMGQAIQATAENMDVTFCGLCDVGDDPSQYIAEADVILDFSFHEVTPKLAKLAAENNKPMVIGTTGHTEEERAYILEATKSIPLVWAGNYSIGVNVMNWLTAQATRILGADYEAEVMEMHHNKKKDSPSGTAERLIEIIRKERNLSEDQVVHGRKGLVGERPRDEIGVHAVRGGGIIGEHTVFFIDQRERLELTHRAFDRGIFAGGALRACVWAVGEKPGLYNMEDILGLKI
jgi:4-hydroxy-tetrahydrodipicolinate reductase